LAAAEKKPVLVFGNPLAEGDSLALRVCRALSGKLNGFEFIETDSLDNARGKEIVIVDVAEGVPHTEVVDDISKVVSRQPIGGHDLDLGFELRLLQKLGRLGKVRLIVIPKKYDYAKALREVEEALTHGHIHNH